MRCSDACVCSIQPFPSHTPQHGERISQANASLLVLVWLSEGFLPFTNSLFSLQLFLYFLSFALFADCKKTRGKNFVLETFVGEKGGRTRKTNFILYFILLKKQETPERVKPLNRQDVRESLASEDFVLWEIFLRRENYFWSKTVEKIK